MYPGGDFLVPSLRAGRPDVFLSEVRVLVSAEVMIDLRLGPECCRSPRVDWRLVRSDMVGHIMGVEAVIRIEAASN